MNTRTNKSINELMNDGINYKIIKNTRMNKWMQGLSEMRERINEYKNKWIQEK